MAGAKVIVIYPRPTDIEAFEQVYKNEHVPMAVQKLAGKTKIVATKVMASPQGTPPFYRIAEIHFPSMAALETCAASAGAKGRPLRMRKQFPQGDHRFSSSLKRRPSRSERM